MLNEYREDLRTECEKFGEVKKVILFDVSLMSAVVIQSQNKEPVCTFLSICNIYKELVCGDVCAAETPRRCGIYRVQGA